jgi:hypothetical protein
LKVHHNPHHRVAVINDFDNLDALRGWKGDIDSFQLGRTGASDRAQAYIDGNVGEEGEFPAGRGYLSSNTARDGVASKGTIRSPAFTLRGDILEYYLTGTGGDGVALELVDTEADGSKNVIASAVTSSAFFVHYYWPINPRWVGREVYLRLVDKSSRGYIEVDAIRMVEFDVNGNEK